MSTLSQLPSVPTFGPSFDNVVRLVEVRRLAEEELRLADHNLTVTRRTRDEADELLMHAVVLDKREALMDADAALEDGIAHRKMVLNGL